ncbi:hypothetical protein GYA19_05295 [Candidatus Beckwithbacteria bacterium]|nr:hypothetical protein [Candidatus Beckwithbacteria bacterium]
MVNKQQLYHYFYDLGLDQDETKIYLALLNKGLSTVLEIAKETKINRTTLYRRLENLVGKNLIELIIDEKRTLYKAVDLDNLEQVIIEKTAKLKTLQDNFKQIKNYLIGEVGYGQPGTRVQFYRGVQGIKQMYWHALKAKNEFVGYSYLTSESIVGYRFIERWSQEFINRGLKGRDLISQVYLDNRKEFPEAKGVNWASWQTRLLPEKVFIINHQMDIYNDIIAMYNWHNGEIFGVEIYNEKIAQMHKQMFEVFWQMGKAI